LGTNKSREADGERAQRAGKVTGRGDPGMVEWWVKEKIWRNQEGESREMVGERAGEREGEGKKGGGMWGQRGRYGVWTVGGRGLWKPGWRG
jgi:hypothetical protein